MDLQKFWDHFLAAWPNERMLFTLGTWFVLEFSFWGINGLLYLCYHYDLFSSYKINPGKFPDQKLINDTLKRLMVNHFLVRPIVLYYLYPIFKKYGMETSPLPSLFSIVIYFGCFMVINDFLFYWSHRLLHHPLLYKHIHKQHHMYNYSIGIAAEYAHPIEDIISNGFPTIAGPLFMGSHLIIIWIWLFLRVAETVESHGGYNFPFSPWRIFPFQTGSDVHDFHHSHNVGNYGAFFKFWDWICGTDKPYKEWKRKQKTM